MTYKQLNRRLLRLEQDPDEEVLSPLTGMTVEQVLVAASQRPGLYEELVRAALEGRAVRMTTPEENEAQLPAADQGRAGDAGEPASPATAAENEPPPPAPPPKTPGELYAEEKCRWRLRGPEDYDWDDEPKGGYFCEFGYDPLERP